MAASGDGSTPLSRLLVAARLRQTPVGAKPRSLRILAAEARAQGLSLNHDTAARYFRGDHGKPEEATLEAFAAVLGVSLKQLRRAADLPDELTTPYEPPPEASRLSRRQRAAVNEIIRAMLEPGAERSAGAPARRAARRGSVEPPSV